jgi:uncharacterized protein
MSNGRRLGSAQRRLVLAGSLLALAVTACASGGTPLPARPTPGAVAASSPLFSHSLPDAEAWLRHYVFSGDHDAALQLVRRSEARERDVLLRSLQEGVILHEAGRYTESNRAFEAAEREADLRYTRSVARGAGSLLISDRLLAYSPSAGEIVLIPYFRMRNYLAIGLIDGAAVEARKANALLARLSNGRDPCGNFGMVQYLAGLVLDAAGEANEALVTLRLADRSLTACAEKGGRHPPVELGQDLLRVASRLGVDEVVDSVRSRYDLPPGSETSGLAEIVVVLDEGFAAHRVSQDVLVPIFRSEVEDVTGDENSASVLGAAGLITARVVASLAGVEQAVLWDRRVWNPVADHNRFVLGRTNGEIAYLLRLSWPVTRLEAHRPSDVRLRVGGETFGPVVTEDVSGRLVRELESRRAAMLGRMVIRGVARYVAVRELEDAAEKKGGEVLGFLVGMAGNAAANALERADTRSWSLLPDRIALARVQVPAGTHEISLEVPGLGGTATHILDLGEVSLAPGQRIFVSQRLWGDHPGDRDRLMRLGAEVLESEPWEPAQSSLPPPPPRSARARPVPVPNVGGGQSTTIVDERIPVRPSPVPRQ